MNETAPETVLRQALATRLRSLVEREPRRLGEGTAPLFISAFVARQREVITAFATATIGARSAPHAILRMTCSWKPDHAKGALSLLAEAVDNRDDDPMVR